MAASGLAGLLLSGESDPLGSQQYDCISIKPWYGIDMEAALE